jgi:hypothetical protein
MVQISGFGLGFLFTNIFLFSLSLLYLIDFRYKMAKNSVYFSFLALGGIVLLLFLVALVQICKTIIDIFFLEIEKNAVYRALVFGIIWGIILFPFIADKVKDYLIKRMR